MFIKFRTNSKKLKRSRQIITVLINYGLDYFIDKSKIGMLTKIKKIPKSYQKLGLSERICLSLEELGPTFVKFGQILSTRPDFLPPAFIKELEKLQDQVPPFDSFQAKEIIKKELNKPIDKLFKKFEEIPIASASLSQVHKATLPNNEIVAVKIQRPNIEEIIKIDLEILEDLAGFVDRRLFDNWIYHPKLMIKEFKRVILKEIDFRNEADHFEKFRTNFKDIDYVKVPKIYRDITTKKILTMEFIEGTKISEITKDEYKDIFDPKEVAKRGASIVLKQIFEDGFFHGDPHPANIFILPQATICMLDVGMVGYVDETIISNGTKLLQAVIDKNLDQTIDSLESLGVLKKEFDESLLRKDLSELIEHYVEISLKDIDIRQLMQDTTEVIVNHDLVLPDNLALMVKSLSMVESIGRKLDPDFNIISVSRPFLNKIINKRFTPEQLLKRSNKFIRDSIELVEKLPQDLIDGLKKFKEGKLKFVFEHRGLEQLNKEINLLTLRISISIIIASLIIGSSLIIQKGSSISSYSILGIIGYIIAILLSIILVISILKSGRKK
jgi:ubiquinone biosynthesis protein